MARGALCTMALSCLVVALAGVSQADVPQLINYQGRLTDTAGRPVNGTVKLGFSFYEQSAPPADPNPEIERPLYYEEQNVTVQEGIFNVLIGGGINQKGSFDSIASKDPVYLEVRDYGSGMFWERMIPRQRIASVVFALRAGTADGMADLQARVAALEELLQHFSRDDNNIYIDGANLHIRNKMDATETTNGVGNLIVGYNEWRDVEGGGIRTGSHNVIVGAQQDFSSYGAVVAGRYNSSYGPYASVTGGEGNTASGAFASVAGGRYNKAEGEYASVAGGGGHLASCGNRAFGNYTAILGGQQNLAGDVELVDHEVGERSTISGGWGNITRGWHASVSGGYYNVARGTSSSISGGVSGDAAGKASSVSGGQANYAGAEYSSVSGGTKNEARGSHSSVSGGEYNTAGGGSASVSGGKNNEAGMTCSSVSGGRDNIASGLYCSVSGGEDNDAGGVATSISGGKLRTTDLYAKWRAGDLWTEANQWPVCTQIEIRGGADLAEPFDVSGGTPAKPGMVMAIDPQHPGQLRVAEKAYDPTVAGIVSGANGVRPGVTMKHKGTAADGSLNVALTGRVYCWCDASNGGIKPGDLLTTSSTPGHAMKATDPARTRGAVLGKAMNSLDEGRGLVLVLAGLQ